jgi:hypothetical protein
MVKDFIRLLGLLRGDWTNRNQKATEQKCGGEGSGNKTKSALHGHEKAPGTTRQEYHLPAAAESVRPVNPAPIHYPHRCGHNPRWG